MFDLEIDPITLEDTVTLPTYTKHPISLVRGEGVYVWDADGKRYLDLYGGHCVALLGHSPERVVAAIREQSEQLLFYSNTVYSPVRARTAQRLVDLAPNGLDRVFFCNSGAEANEAALKLAVATTGRKGIVAMEGGFHGRTLGSLAATWGDSYHAPYHGLLPDVTHVPFGDTGVVRGTLEDGTVAAVILEPIQSMAGVIEAEPSYYQALRKMCDETGTLLIFDEVQTGIGRTGAFSYGEHVGVVPDFMTLAKSLGAGVPVGAVLVNDAIAETVKPGDQGTTFGGGMLAMAAVEATLATLTEEGLMERALELESAFRNALEPVLGVVEVRGRGGLLGIQLDREAKPVIAGLREVGILVGGANEPHTIRLMPPLITPFEAAGELAEMLFVLLNS